MKHFTKNRNSKKSLNVTFLSDANYLNLSRCACKIGSNVAAVSDSVKDPVIPLGEYPAADEVLASMLTSLTASATQSLALACP